MRHSKPRLFRAYASTPIAAMDAFWTAQAAETFDRTVHVIVYVSRRSRLYGWLERQLRWAWRRFRGRPLYYAIIDGKAA